MSTSQTSYDELPYGDNPFYHTHPDCLATVARLHGLQPPPVETCRVLELGCACGGNLIPMAQTLPDGRFVGIDLSPRQIDSGRRVVQALGLSNIDLRPLSIMDVDASFGQFDYIVCHGVYSWVPAGVQDKILDICRHHLAPAGLAYISYNTYPGWHVRGMIRGMLSYAVRPFEEARVRVEQARAFLDFVVRSIPDANGLYASLLKKEVGLLGSESDTYFFHEYLEEENQPLYFHEFAERVAAKELRYLGEAKANMLIGQLSVEARTVLQQLSDDPIQREQVLDFLCNRTFRRTILCHAAQEPAAGPSVEAVPELLVCSAARPLSPTPDVASNAVEKFQTPDEVATLSTNNPLVKSALVHLYEQWPRAVPFATLWHKVRASLEVAENGDPGPLAAALLQCFLSNLVELHVYVPRLATTAGERPVASPLARLQAGDSESVTNLRHSRASLEPGDRLVLRHLDGRHDRAALAQVLSTAAAAGQLTLAAEPLDAVLEQILAKLATFAFLVE